MPDATPPSPPTPPPKTSFLNPYHFIPIPAEIPAGISRDAVDAGLAADGNIAEVEHLRHDSYGTDETGAALNSGRIICRLETVSPCVFGGSHQKSYKDEHGQKWGALVSPLELKPPQTPAGDNAPEEVPAISGASLKGMISNLVEAASGSAFRVLHNTRLTVRTYYKRAMAAVGIIVELPFTPQKTASNAASETAVEPASTAKPRRMLLPLTLPGLGCDDSSNTLHIRNDSESEAWNNYLGSREQCRQALPGYIYGYQSEPDGHTFNVKEKTLCSIPPADRSTLYHIEETLPSFQFEDVQGHPRFTLTSGKPFVTELHFSKDKKTPVSAQFRNAENEYNHTMPTVPTVRSISQIDASRGTIGFIRRLAMPPAPTEKKNTGDLTAPSSKTHETYIPLNNFLNSNKDGFIWDDPSEILDELLEVEQAATTFEENVEELQKFHNDHRPFRLAGDDRQRVKLVPGDLVHFRLSSKHSELDKDGHRFQQVESVAISSIWRDDVGSIDRFFSLAAMEELLPMNPNRGTLTKAEAMFGFVEDKTRLTVEGEPKSTTDADEQPAKCPRITALAGRVRISPAWLDLKSSKIQKAKDAYLEGGKQYRLQILASPKLPCPEMYFRGPRSSDDSSRISKRRLQEAVAGQHPTEIQGRKMYLHRPKAIPQPGQSPDAVWQTNKPRESTRQKALVQPLKPQQVFYFSIDFLNLTQDELNLLLYALRPFEAFRHKLGMGKPLGLGTIKIDPQVVLTVDRRQRYRQQRTLLAGRGSARYASCVFAPSFDQLQWPDWLANDKREALHLGGVGLKPTKWEEFHGSPEVDEAVAHALKILGSVPESEQPDVHYPIKNIDPSAPVDLEAEHFRWFEHALKDKSGGNAHLVPVKSGKTLTDLGLLANPHSLYCQNCSRKTTLPGQTTCVVCGHTL